MSELLEEASGLPVKPARRACPPIVLAAAKGHREDTAPAVIVVARAEDSPAVLEQLDELVLKVLARRRQSGGG